MFKTNTQSPGIGCRIPFLLVLTVVLVLTVFFISSFLLCVKRARRQHLDSTEYIYICYNSNRSQNPCTHKKKKIQKKKMHSGFVFSFVLCSSFETEQKKKKKSWWENRVLNQIKYSIIYTNTIESMKKKIKINSKVCIHVLFPTNIQFQIDGNVKNKKQKIQK